MHIAFEHVGVQTLVVQARHAVSNVRDDALEPGDVLLLEVAHAPDVSALDEGEQVQAAQRLAVPVQIGQQQVSLVLGSGGVRRAKQDVFLLGASVEDVEDPVQAALVALALHVRPHVVAVDVGRLGHVADRLRRVLFQMLLGAWVDEVDLQVGWLALACTAVGHVPAVYIIVAEVLDVRQRAAENRQVGFFRGKGGALGEKQCWR